MVSNLLKRLSQRGWQMTPQRRVVAEVLAGPHVHLTADEVHALAAARLPEISRATVYKTLAELAELGEVREVAIGGRAKRYDPNTDSGHHHLICERCGLIRDVYPEGEQGLSLSGEQSFGFTLKGVDLVFRGICPACREAESQGSPGW